MNDRVEAWKVLDLGIDINLQRALHLDSIATEILMDRLPESAMIDAINAIKKK